MLSLPPSFVALTGQYPGRWTLDTPVCRLIWLRQEVQASSVRQGACAGVIDTRVISNGTLQPAWWADQVVVGEVFNKLVYS